MKFTKQDLLFLEMYNVCADTKNILHNKLIIQADSKNKKVKFAQISSEASLYTEIDKDDIEKDFDVIYDINTFCSVLRLTPDTEEIYISETTIKFGKNSSYDFKKYNIDSSIISTLTQSKEVLEIVLLKDSTKLNLIKSFIGVDSFAAVHLWKGWFVASNSTDITGAVQTTNNLDNFVLPKTLLQLISLIKVDEISFEKINMNGNIFYKININHTNIYFPEKESKIQNIFEDETRELYYHKTKAITNKESLVLALQRISITASQNIYNRINMIFNENVIRLINDEVGHSEEIIDAQVDKELFGVKISLSSNYLKLLVGLIEGSNIILLVANDSDATAITIEGETKDRFFVHNLYELVDFNK